ncbi:MAG TPA: methyl-accepting chemotaxis protein, partial [Gammaproteobacteria bacterium]|nr:methyl-accepting chemotaxis protein [Gammaproteobacteria bacterium]
MTQFWQRLGLGAQIGIFTGAAMLILVGFLLTGYAFKARETVIDGEVAKARGLVLMAESAREQMAKKWEKGIYSTDKVRKWAAAADSKEERKDMILSAVPVVTAWRTAQAKAKEAGFEFKPIREHPRNKDHTASPTEMRGIRYFRNHRQAKEYNFVDEKRNAVRYFRPVRLTKVCLNCHGDPTRSQELWGRPDGTDITGHQMENKKVGDLHGAFEVILPLAAAEATIAGNLWEGILGALVLLAAALGTLLWGIQRGICRPIHATVAQVGTVTEQGDLTVRAPESGIREMGKLGRTFNTFLQKLAGLFGDWRQQSSQLASASEELSATADEISRNAQSSTKRMEEVAGSAQEVNQVVQDVASNISEVSDSASQSTQTTQEGMKAVEQASQRINQLKVAGERVDEIMETIQAIAKKTDLLALNAAIEA